MDNCHRVRTSTILVGVGGRVEAYSSVEELPPDLRKRLLESTSGTETATLVIADRAGREAVRRALREQGRQRGAVQRPRPLPRALAAWARTWGAILLAGAAGLAAWLAATWR
jgi:hypothetical protein